MLDEWTLYSTPIETSTLPSTSIIFPKDGIITDRSNNHVHKKVNITNTRTYVQNAIAEVFLNQF